MPAQMTAFVRAHLVQPTLLLRGMQNRIPGIAVSEEKSMKTTRIVSSFLAVAFALAATACSSPGSADGGKVIKSVKSSDMTITLSNSTGELKKGDNDLMVTFADDSGKPVDVGAASLNIHMAAMGAMAEMNNKATLTTTETPGRFRAQVNIEMSGTWEAQIKYQGAHGSGQASMSVQAR
jgi:hypothetical protein